MTSLHVPVQDDRPVAPAAPEGSPLVPSRRRPSEIRRRRVVAVLAVALVALFWVRVLLGDYTIAFVDFFRIVSGEQIPGATYILMDSKLPRAVLSVLVGIAFGVGGAVFQGVLRNPLASPDVIGISVGASASAVIAISFLGLTDAAVSVAAVLGALGCAVLVRAVAGGTGGHRLVLGGIGISAGLVSVIHYVFIRSDDWDVQSLLHWMTGSVSGADWDTIAIFAVLLVLLLPCIAVLARSMRVIELGDDTAAGLGVSGRQRDLLLAVATVLVACAVAASGPIAFVAFMAGPISRMLLGGRSSLVAAALVGACMVVAGDHIGAYAISSVNLPVGVVTGALGAPFLLWLLSSGRTGRKVA